MKEPPTPSIHAHLFPFFALQTVMMACVGLKAIRVIRSEARSTSKAARSPRKKREPSPSGPQLHLAYRTGWQTPHVHYSLNGGEWTSQPMQKGRVTSAGPDWAYLSLHHNANDGAPAGQNGTPALEFVISDGGGSWDKPGPEANYLAHDFGRWILKDGSLAPASTPAVLLVSDLDDTLVGDDRATLAFTQWWLDVGAPAGGRLVYNTGRALDLFESLLEEKRHCMVEPDLLISAVGTRIYKKQGSAWEEDQAYTSRLGANWNLDAARDAAYAALAAAGKDAMHFRAPSEMNEHKITCGVRADVLGSVLERIATALEADKVEHRLIVSGSGEWRYLDLVPAAAGKLQALEYARKELGFSHQHTVACGDSGNDRDMLEGQHFAVVVGNAQPDLMEWAQSAQNGAKRGKKPLIVEGHRAHGVLEGLQRLGFRE